METPTQTIFNICEANGVPIAIANQIAHAVNKMIADTHTEAYNEGYENARIETKNSAFTEGYDEGKTAGEALGIQEVLDELDVDLDISDEAKEALRKRFQGGKEEPDTETALTGTGVT